MSKELELYKAFIDGLVERKDSMTALWVKGDGFPKTEDNKAKNELLAALTPEQKGVLAEMLQDEHIAGIHDTLAYINEMMDLEGLELHQDGESYAKPDINTQPLFYSLRDNEIYLDIGNEGKINNTFEIVCQWMDKLLIPKMNELCATE